MIEFDLKRQFNIAIDRYSYISILQFDNIFMSKVALVILLVFLQWLFSLYVFHLLFSSVFLVLCSLCFPVTYEISYRMTFSCFVNLNYSESMNII